MKTLLLLFICVLTLSFTAVAQNTDCDCKHELGVSYNFLRGDVTFQQIQNPSLRFNETTDSHGVRIHGTDFLGKGDGGPLGFTVEYSYNRGDGRVLQYIGVGATLKKTHGIFKPFIKGTVGASRQNDVERTPGIGLSFRGTGLAFNLGAGVDFRVARHVSIRAAEISWLRTDMGKGGQDISRNNLTAGAGLVFHWN